MNGVDKKRIVGIDDKHIDHLLCPICWKVFTEPTVTQCCGQTYCKTCITRWINERHVCPEDGRPLKPFLLISAPKLVKNLLNDLNVKCVNHERGCKAVVKMDQLNRHLEECRHKYQMIPTIKQELYYPSVSADNAVNYEFWLELRLRQVLRDGIRIRKKDVTIIKGSNDNNFIAIFDKNDIDFEIQVENCSEHNICYKLKLDNHAIGNCFVVRKGMTSSLISLDNDGRHLHYKSQTAEEGRNLVARNAHNSRSWIPYLSQNSSNCSKLRFKIEIELGDQEYEEAVEHRRRSKMQTRQVVMTQRRTVGTRICLTVDIQDKIIRLMAFVEDKIAVLKHLIEDKEGVAVEEQRLIFNDTVLQNDMTIRDYGIPFNAHLQLITDQQTNCADPKMLVAERGVICFGPETDQRFMAFNKPFVKSNKYLVQGFTIEFRTKSNIWLNH